jgi:hypothetical protein
VLGDFSILHFDLIINVTRGAFIYAGIEFRTPNILLIHLEDETLDIKLFDKKKKVLVWHKGTQEVHLHTYYEGTSSPSSCI